MVAQRFLVPLVGVRIPTGLPLLPLLRFSIEYDRYSNGFEGSSSANGSKEGFSASPNGSKVEAGGGGGGAPNTSPKGTESGLGSLPFSAANGSKVGGAGGGGGSSPNGSRAGGSCSKEDGTSSGGEAGGAGKSKGLPWPGGVGKSPKGLKAGGGDGGTGSTAG